MALRTDYKNWIPDSDGRRYRIVPIGETGLSEIKDATTYLQEGDRFGADELNETNEVVNSLRTNIGLKSELPIPSESTLGDVYYSEDTNEFLYTQKIKNGNYTYKNHTYLSGPEENLLDYGYYHATDTDNWYLDGVLIKPNYVMTTPTASQSLLNNYYVSPTKACLKYGNKLTDVTQRLIGNGSYVDDYGYVCVSDTTGPIFDLDISTLISAGVNKVKVKLIVPAGTAFVSGKVVSLNKNNDYSSDVLTSVSSQSIIQSQQIYTFNISSDDFTSGDCLAISFDHPDAVISDIWFETNTSLILNQCVEAYDYVWSKFWNILYIDTFDNLETTYPASKKYLNLIVYAEDTNQIYKCNEIEEDTYEWGNIGSGGDANITYLSLDEYEDLTPEQQTNGTTYHIYDDYVTPSEGTTPASQEFVANSIKQNNDTVTIVTIPIDNWVTDSDGTNTYYTREITVQGMYPEFVGTKETDYVRVYTGGKLDITATETAKEMWNLLLDIESDTNKIKVYASEIPTTAFQIYIYGNLTIPQSEWSGLKFTSTGNSTVGYNVNGTVNKNIYTSPDGQIWTSWDGTPISLADGESIYVWNKQNTLGTSNSDYLDFTMTGTISASGNINSMVNFNEVSSYCYRGMFAGCTSLITAPNLPSIVLAESCYRGMFANCTSLNVAPTLPASSLVSNCYYGMFYGCSNINSIKLNYTGNFSTDYFSSWVYGVNANGTIYYNGTDTTKGANAIPTNFTVQSF